MKFIFLVLLSIAGVSHSNADIGADGVVQLRPYSMQYTATGFYLEYKGKQVLITNKHVCGTETKLYKIEEPMAVYSVIKASEYYDLCLLRVDKPTKTPFYLTEKPLLQGEVGFICGYPMRRRFEQIGIVGQVIQIPVGGHEPEDQCKPPRHWEDEYGVCLEDEVGVQIKYALIRPGNSGSPMFRSDRSILGVVNAGDDSGAGIMVPVVFLKNFLLEALP